MPARPPTEPGDWPGNAPRDDYAATGERSAVLPPGTRTCPGPFASPTGNTRLPCGRPLARWVGDTWRCAAGHRDGVFVILPDPQHPHGQPSHQETP